jgi:hypothetical protein
MLNKCKEIIKELLRLKDLIEYDSSIVNESNIGEASAIAMLLQNAEKTLKDVEDFWFYVTDLESYPNDSGEYWVISLDDDSYFEVHAAWYNCTKKRFEYKHSDINIVAWQYIDTPILPDYFKQQNDDLC